MAEYAEKSPAVLEPLANNFIVSAVRDGLSAFSQRRELLGLANPGTVDGVGKEVQRDVFLNGSMFAGLRADLSKSFSVAPMFQTSHAFSIGSQGLQPYTFIASYGTPKIFLHGTIDNEGQLSTRANYRWNEALVTRTQMQISSDAEQSVVQIENDYTGKDFSASIKALNPSILDNGLTGVVMASYLQSVTARLALGMEAIWQRPAMNTGPEAAVSYVGRYRGSDWIVSAQLQAQGALNTSYWRRLSDKVEVGADVTVRLQPSMNPRGGLLGGLRKEGVATLGAKYDFRASTFRAQVDSTGRLSALLEKRVLPFVQIAFAGELDQFKQQTKLGLGVSVEIPNEDIMEQQEKAMTSNTPLPPF